jgi:hypothetical protein
VAAATPLSLFNVVTAPIARPIYDTSARKFNVRSRPL